MKVRRSFFALTLVIFIGLLVLAIPESGFAQPHTCPGGTHLSSSPNGLGGVATYTFVFAKVCSGTDSGALYLKYSVYNYSNNQLVCSDMGNPIDMTAHPTFSVSCGTGVNDQAGNPEPALQTGLYPKVKVALQYQTSQGGSWMPHTDLFANKAP